MRISLTGEVTKRTFPVDRISKNGDRFLTFAGKNEFYEAGIAFVSRGTDLLAYPRIEIFFDSDAEKWVIL
jgi:hypothetical protein